MAVCFTAALVLPAAELRYPPASLRPSDLSAFRPLRLAPLRPLAARSQRLTLLPQRRVLPRIQAKKETFSSFDELLEKCDMPVLVDFYATWCGPCQFMVPVLEEVSEKMKDKIQVVKIDTEKYTTIANRYKIEALPTFIIFKDGKPFDRFEGAMPANQLIQRIEDALKVKK
ncbi:thioredoxin Y, chloroplastic [Canna indica]|uniref:Thioredoxin Y, chloroplastic n=1 Tax=Canna indica TaxID=4628 RepID=A0AAQ3KV32_9LILI|nr:thioredoxin Y, chloroplastic [Canna indica]